MSQAEWFCVRNKQKVGPFTTEQMRQEAEQGRLLPADMVLQKGQPRWMPASAFTELFPSPTPTLIESLIPASAVVPIPPVQARPAPPASNLGRLLRKRPLWPMLTAAGVLLLFVVSGIAWLASGGSSREVAKAEPTTREASKAAGQPSREPTRGTAPLPPPRSTAATGFVVPPSTRRTPPPDTRPQVNPDPPPPPPAGPGPQVVFLQAPEEPTDFAVGRSYRVLERELFRQAMLLAAREELGLTTRDPVLGEGLAEAIPPNQRLQVASVCNFSQGSRCIVSSSSAPQTEVLFSDEYSPANTPNTNYADFLHIAEGYSRGQFVQVLKKAGFSGRSRPAGDAPLPAAIEKQVESLSYTSQFAAIRELHTTIRKEGESPALLGALVRAYANLGLLTEHHWNAAPRVFKARALLYAERMLAREPRSAWGLWHRAYAEALTGLHQLALNDLAAANKANDPRGRRPAWTDALEAYCRFDAARLAELSKNEAQASLALFLRFLAIEDLNTVDLTMRVAAAALERSPENYRIHDSIANLGGVGNRHRTTLLGMGIMTTRLPDRLRELPGLPETTGALLQRNAPEAQVLKSLIAAGLPLKDGGEFTWGILGQLTQETRFLQVYRRILFMRHMWSVPVDDFLGEALPLVADHPGRPLIQSFGLDAQRDREAFRKLVLAWKPADPSVIQMTLFQLISGFDPKLGNERLDRAARFGDNVYREGFLLMQYLSDGQSKTLVAEGMLLPCPHAPLARAILIDGNWPRVEKQAAEWEKTNQHPAVMRSLARRYASLNRVDDAVRCWKQALAVSPDYNASTSLAELYRKQGKHDEWKATLEATLAQPDHGLEHAQVRVKLAEHHMARKEWKLAEPYAEAAAETWAAWAMLCASQCAEGQEDWRRAELWVRRTAERYPENSFDWFFFCKRTGKGDVQAAEKRVDLRIQELNNRHTDNDLLQLGVYFLVTHKPERAQEVFASMAQRGKAPWVPLMLATIHDELGKTDLRDRVLKDAAAQKTPYAPLAESFRQTLAKGEKEKPDAKALEELLSRLPAFQQAEASYIVARFVKNRGDTDTALRFFDRSALDVQSPLMRTLSVSALRDHGFEPGKLPRREP